MLVVRDNTADPSGNARYESGIEARDLSGPAGDPGESGGRYGLPSALTWDSYLDPGTALHVVLAQHMGETKVVALETAHKF